MNLGQYLAAAAAMPWEWGVHDCTAFPARWAGVPLPDYSNEAEAETMLHAAGGLVALWDRAAPGFADEVSELEAGDVGVIEAIAPNMDVIEIGAVWTGRRWAFVPRAGGIAAASATCLKAWRPLCLKP